MNPRENEQLAQKIETRPWIKEFIEKNPHFAKSTRIGSVDAVYHSYRRKHNIVKNIILVVVLFLMAHLAIGRTIGAMRLSGPESLQNALSRQNSGLFIWFMMLLWVRFYFYDMYEGSPWERRIKAFLILLILMAFGLMAIKLLQGYMAIGWAILITFIVENILSFPLFILLRCPGYKLLQRG